MPNDEYIIHNLQQFIGLWTSIYDKDGRPDWSHILPYYHEQIYFRDCIQEIRGIDAFAAMTERLTKRSKEIEFLMHNSSMSDHIIFLEWEMIISYKKYPKSSVYGASRLTLREGKIIEQRDYYDLWGDIFDNIPFIKKGYRKFMKWKFG